MGSQYFTMAWLTDEIYRICDIFSMTQHKKIIEKFERSIVYIFAIGWEEMLKKSPIIIIDGISKFSPIKNRRGKL